MCLHTYYNFLSSADHAARIMISEQNAFRQH
jgi:hypothetical protein